MKCKKVKSFLLDFYEGELHKDREKMIACHLVSCPFCREELKSVEKVIKSLKTKKLNDPSADFRDSFLPKVKKALASEKSDVSRYSFCRRAKDLIMIFSVPKIRFAAISGIAGIILIFFISFKLAVKAPEIKQEAKVAVKSLQKTIMEKGYTADVIENILTSSKEDFLFSKKTSGKASWPEIVELYNASASLVTSGNLSEEIYNRKEGFLNGSHIYWEIEELDEQELKIFSEELRLRYSST